MKNIVKSKLALCMLSASLLAGVSAPDASAANKSPIVGYYEEPDYIEFKIGKIKNGTHSYQNSTEVRGKDVGYRTVINVTKNSKGVTLNSFKVEAWVKKGTKTIPYLTNIWVQYKDGSKQYLPKGPNRFLKNGVIVSHKNLNLKDLENINVYVNDDLIKSAKKKGTKYRQGINFTKK